MFVPVLGELNGVDIHFKDETRFYVTQVGGFCNLPTITGFPPGAFVILPSCTCCGKSGCFELDDDIKKYINFVTTGLIEKRYATWIQTI